MIVVLLCLCSRAASPATSSSKGETRLMTSTVTQPAQRLAAHAATSPSGASSPRTRRRELADLWHFLDIAQENLPELSREQLIEWCGAGSAPFPV
jgi:hypothetical protein